VASTNTQKLHQLGIELHSYPPYSSDLSPTDSHFFRSLDNYLALKRFRKQEDSEITFQHFLSPKDSNFRISQTDAPAIRQQKCIKNYANYFK
ncbi:Histone-lysine N-methyltransferase SETMAR, partial [Habropoda laboriosa]